MNILDFLLGYYNAVYLINTQQTKFFILNISIYIYYLIKYKEATVLLSYQKIYSTSYQLIFKIISKLTP